MPTFDRRVETAGAGAHAQGAAVERPRVTVAGPPGRAELGVDRATEQAGVGAHLQAAVAAQRGCEQGRDVVARAADREGDVVCGNVDGQRDRRQAAAGRPRFQQRAMTRERFVERRAGPRRRADDETGQDDRPPVQLWQWLGSRHRSWCHRMRGCRRRHGRSGMWEYAGRRGDGDAQHSSPDPNWPRAPAMTDSPSTPARRHFSMLRDFHLADAFTLANAACGVGGVLMAMRFLVTHDTRELLLAAAFAPAALVFDVLDGRVARWRQTSSALGRELDSLADVISFGVAPAALAFACGLDGVWDALILAYFVCCGVSRLARYNVTAESLSAGSDKGGLLRRNADPDQRAAHCRARLCRVAVAYRRRHLRRLVGAAPGRAASALAAVRPVGDADGQQDAAHPQALTTRALAPVQPARNAAARWRTAVACISVATERSSPERERPDRS